MSGQPDTLAHAAPEQVGRYRILGPAGEGGMGAVYRAHDPHLGRDVAVKLPHIAGRPDAALLAQRFQREARAAARVWHPHVCPIYDVGEHEGRPFAVMPFIEGQSLASRLADGPRPSPREAVALLLQILDALEAIHSHGLIHRDLKPANILLDQAGRPLVADFGLARPEDASRLTADGAVMGTPAYMAPEQAAGQGDQIGPWTDVYSAGVVLHEMVTGRLPHGGEADGAPSGLGPALRRALARDPSARYRRAADFARDLRAWVDDVTSVLPPQPAPPRRPGGWTPFLLAILGSAALTAAILVGVSYGPAFFAGLTAPPDAEVLDYLDGKQLEWPTRHGAKALAPLTFDKHRVGGWTRSSAVGSYSDDPEKRVYNYELLLDQDGAAYIVALNVTVKRIGGRRLYLGHNVAAIQKADAVKGR